MSRGAALVLTPRPPWPLDDGGRIGLWQFTWTVAREYETTLLTLQPASEEAGEPPAELREWGTRVVRVTHRPPPGPLAMLQGWLGRWPYTIARYRSGAFDRALRRAVRETRPRFALVNHLHLASYADSLEGTALVLRQHNLESAWLARYAETLHGPARLYARAQAARMLVTETQLCARMDVVLAIHEPEAAAIRAMSPLAHVEVVPVGVDFARFRPHAPSDPPVVLLTGSFAWPPNDSGARRFLAEGWPRVRARVPTARLRLVGKDMSESLREAARAAGGEPVGYVDDIAAEFSAASLMVVPLWAGAGMRVKIVESMVARLPVVATALAAEGLELESGRHGELAETPAALGDSVAGLLLDPRRAGQLAAAAHEHALQRWSLRAVAARTTALCEFAVERRARRR